MNIATARMCSLGYAIKKEKNEPNRTKGRLGMAQSSGRCRGDYGRREPVQRKTTRMSGFTAGRRASLLIGVCGACGSIILKRDLLR